MFTAQLSNLEKLRAECEEVKMLIPDKVSESGDTMSRGDGASTDDFESDVCTGSPSPSTSSFTSPAHTASGRQSPDVPIKPTSPVMDDLDLLPTKEEPVRLSMKMNENLIGCSENGGNWYLYFELHVFFFCKIHLGIENK